MWLKHLVTKIRISWCFPGIIVCRLNLNLKVKKINKTGKNVAWTLSGIMSKVLIWWPDRRALGSAVVWTGKGRRCLPQRDTDPEQLGCMLAGSHHPPILLQRWGGVGGWKCIVSSKAQRKGNGQI